MASRSSSAGWSPGWGHCILGHSQCLSPSKCKTGYSKFNAGGNPTNRLALHQSWGVEIFLVTSCYRNLDKLWPDGPLGSYADFTLLTCKRSVYMRGQSNS